MDQQSREHPPRWLGVAVFIMSGFAGLVYEATWARYLKGVLGHEAYAQALVLGIFLGGLAAGAALVGRRADRIKSPLVLYAVIEAVLALAAIYFHDFFVLVREIIEGGTHTAGPQFRWASMTAIILPQSVLLGATFPLLASAMTRSDPRESGKTVSMLYFANSFGGVIGALAVGLVLVDLGGLPGSMYAGGIASAAAGLAAWAAHHRFEPPKPIATALFEGGGMRHPKMLLFLACAAFGTGLASLVYEIVWIRMLALVLGSSTRAFEIMLATFILGLALGGLAVRRWVDHPTRLRTIAWAQLLMGAFVIVTMFFYEQMFHLFSDARVWLPRTERGYLVYGFVSFLFSLALMFLPTFFAGMTLPLLTREAMVTQGERSLGIIYAWNTLGAIAGILLAVHVLLPAAGLKNALLAGVVIDLVLGVMFLRLARPRLFTKGAVAAAAAVAAALVHAPFSSKVLASGPYRIPFEATMESDNEIVFTKNGKTSTIFVTETPHVRAVLNNGKSDGSLSKDRQSYNSDMYTNIMSASLALMHKPEARQVGLIGLGTGMTAATFLLSDDVELVETMEIEQAVLESLDYFWTEETLKEDSRSRLIKTDAKTHIMSKPSGSYDIIVSIPSNPWVSGQSGLFSVEHFKQMKRSLAEDGVLVQWFHVYESNPQAMASILAAASEVFPVFELFMLGGSDIALLASPDPAVPGAFAEDALERMPRLAERLAMIDVRSVNDAKALSAGNKDLLMPYFESFGVGPNSDYFPLLERYAALGFYQSTVYSFNFLVAVHGHLFNGNTLPGRRLREPFAQVSASKLSGKQQQSSLATAMLDTSVPLQESAGEVFRHFSETEDVFASLFDDTCSFGEEGKENHALALLEIMEFAEASLYQEEMASLWRRVTEELPCLEKLRDHEYSAKVLAYLEANSVGDNKGVIKSVKGFIGESNPVSTDGDVRALTKMMVALLGEGRTEEAVKEGLRLEFSAAPPQAKHAVRLVGSHAFSN